MSEKRFITEADGVHNEWYEGARNQTLETLGAFVHHLVDDFSHDQSTVVHALVAGGLATITAMNAHPEADISPSQSSQLLGLFIRKWARIEGPAKIMSWAALLTPSYRDQVMTVPKDVVEWLKVVAKQALVDGR
ncbi:MAG: hypothetical protein EB116_17020, partial [Betaproteobacteria bacterium]|nr:hypothetical protein [Betaproteobacteria bacterium]